ncbi:MAG TPA: hypothetical protein PLU97_04515 [Candidatus Cryptobacteroides sp.]|nr:hypothetical protein [Candidatus Cryptobacteroides sp.]
MTEYKSKHGLVNRPQAELYMAFTDLRNFLRFLPEDKQKDVTASFDTLNANVNGISIGVKVTRREPYSYIELQSHDSPLKFTLMLHFDISSENPAKTDFYIIVNAELDFMTKMLIGGKIKDGLNKIVDGLVDVSEGRMPEGVPADFMDKMKF